MFKTLMFVGVISGMLYSALDVPVTVREPSGFASTNYPVSAMVPLPCGQYHDLGSFKLVDGSGSAVPAQFNPIMRYMFRDNSVRFVQVHFSADLPAGGTAAFTLKDDGAGPAPANPVSVTTAGDLLTINTGALKFTVRKSAFNLFNRVWLEPGDILVADSAARQGCRFSLDRAPVDTQWFQDRVIDTFAVEEAGPMRAVIRLESYTQSADSVNQKPGFICRIYAYAGSRLVKVDIGLVNGERTTWGWPIYFRDFSMTTPLVLTSPSARFGLGSGSRVLTQGNGSRLVQWDTDAWRALNGEDAAVDSGTERLPGWFDVSDASKGVMVSERYFWQTYPNGFGFDSNNVLSASPWPATRFCPVSFSEYSMFLDTVEAYCLDDMRADRKEFLYYFHDAAGAADADLSSLCRHFQWPPVASVPYAWHRQCRATLEFGGDMPAAADPGVLDDTLSWSVYGDVPFDKTSGYYSFGWNNFQSDRRRPCQTGDWPRSTAAFLVNGNPGRYFDAERWALGDLNLRTMWCPGWTYAVNQPASGMAYINYCSGIWRSTAMQYYMRQQPPNRAGTHPQSWAARDFEHLWQYHMEEFYNYSGDPWIRDHMTFWCQYFRTFNSEYMNDSTLPNAATRGIGHSFAHFLGAMRITNDTSFLADADSWVRKLSNIQKRDYARFGAKEGEGPFQLEFMDRSIISYMQMIEGCHPLEWQRAFNFVYGHVEWNTNYANYCYYWDPDSTAEWLADTTPGSSGGSYADAQAWMCIQTQQRSFVKNLKQIWNPGNDMYFSTVDWKGDWMGRWVTGWYQNFYNKPGLDTVPPDVITDLAGDVLPWGVRLRFTRPNDASKYHIVWAYKPVKEGPDSSLAPDTLKWWEANPGGIPVATGEAAETCTVVLPIKDTLFYFAVRSFDSLNNISALSNLYSVRANIISAEKGRGAILPPSVTAYPNPFNPEVLIRFDNARPGTKRSVRIYDMAGRLVRDFGAELASDKSDAPALRWNAGARASGVYVIRAVAGKVRLALKVVLSK